MDEIIRAVSSDGTIKIAALSSRGMTERARKIHDASPVATAALGRTMAAASLIGNALKAEDTSVTVRINGGGPIGSIIVVSDHIGNVRGYAQYPQVDLPKKSSGKLDVSGAVGTKGMLSVIRDLNMKEPYVGSTALVSGEIAEDFAAYFTESEQTPSACAFGVLIDINKTVRAAGGYIVSLMPGASDEVAQALEENVAKTGAVTSILDDGSITDIIDKVMSGFDCKIVERTEVAYKCYCSDQRVISALTSIGPDELQALAREGETVEVTCQFCDAVYKFSPDEILRLQAGGAERD